MFDRLLFFLDRPPLIRSRSQLESPAVPVHLTRGIILFREISPVLRNSRTSVARCRLLPRDPFADFLARGFRSAENSARKGGVQVGRGASVASGATPQETR